ncbi:hypothetical protein LIER_38569 [Lithospermum erythrorhizon]|uniref:Uncharacterized protein n=1 Tax=Lithospermum erythrorhizon TaxID=34254 RepID=A0AAV3Q1U2_LITER
MSITMPDAGDSASDDKLMPDEESDEESDDNMDAYRVSKRKSKGKLKKNDNRTRIGNRRVAHDVPNAPLEGIILESEDQRATWKIICGRKIVPERSLSKAIIKNSQTYIDILQDAKVLSMMDNAKRYWVRLVREFVCYLSHKIHEAGHEMYQKVKLRGHIFYFSPRVINSYYGIYNTEKPNPIQPEDGGGLDVKPLTISEKLMKGKGRTTEIEGGDSVKRVRIAELEGKIQALKKPVTPVVSTEKPDVGPSVVATSDGGSSEADHFINVEEGVNEDPTIEGA